ncbi:hypothetical protein MMC22_008210 [Lobaria immixta]|nr:hypothetical protein [Lobaria immixta]
MHCNLIELPAELLLTIIEELRKNEDVKRRVMDEKKYDYVDPETHDESVKVYHDLFKLSCTCSYFRNLLAPDIFKTVKLINDEKSGSSLSTVARSQLNVHVKELHFIGSAPGEAHSEEAAFSDTEGILSRCVDGLLCELRRFPSLERLILNFGSGFKNPCEWSWKTNNFPNDETPEQNLEAEASAAWRALISTTYSALARNKLPHFKHFEIRNFISEDVSTYNHAVFHDFLSHFETFTLSVYSKNRVAGWLLDTIERYPPPVGKLDEYFFNHLANVTTLSIRDIINEHFGLDGRIHTPLPLKVDQMPLLTTLHLDYIFVSPELTDFLVDHKDTLEEMTLRDCYASTGPGNRIGNGIYWAQLFTSLSSACLTKLRCFELVISPISSSFRKPSSVDERYKNVRTILRKDPRRIFFPYAEIYSSGMLFQDWDECFVAFFKGEDQRSWDQLMGMIEGNAKEATTSGSKGVGSQAQS